MATPELVINTASIVLRGVFEVSVLSPQNLADQGLIDANELADATQKFSANNISVLETKRIKFIGNQQLLQFTAQEADDFEPLRDLASGALRLLDSSQLSVLGINHDIHFATANPAAWHAVGDALAPKGIWDDILKLAGTASITIQGERAGKYAGYTQVTVQPSNLVKQGVFVSHNDHYTLEINDNPVSTRDQFEAVLRQAPTVSSEKVSIAINILNEEWEPSMTRSLAAIERVAKQAQP